jgi:membrane-associated protease RseP (regulator of RpoE activity)
LNFLLKGENMNRLLWKKNSMPFALLATIFLGPWSAQAQEAKPSADVLNPSVARLAQGQELFAGGIDFDRQADVALNLSDYKNWRIAALWDSAEDMLGANLQPVGDGLRAQLDIPAGQGLVVERLRGDGACAQAGLQQNDILLSLADKPLGAVGDLIKQLKAAGDSLAPLKILRGGKPVTIKVRPIYRVTLGPVGDQKTEYYIGVSVVAPNDATRAQLGLPENQGVVVSEVESSSPAEKGGVKKHDILLHLNDKPIDSPQTLAHLVQEAKDHPTPLIYRHAGKRLILSITPATRKVEVPPNPDAAYRLLLLNRAEADVARLGLLNTVKSYPVDAYQLLSQNVQNGQPVDANDLRQRLDHLEKELTAVRAALDKINETLKAKNGNK